MKKKKRPRKPVPPIDAPPRNHRMVDADQLRKNIEKAKKR